VTRKEIRALLLARSEARERRLAEIRVELDRIRSEAEEDSGVADLLYPELVMMRQLD
jgi:hypothetical protein